MNLLKFLTNGFRKKDAGPMETQQEAEEETISPEMAIEEVKPKGLERGHQKLTEEQKITMIDLIAQGLSGAQVVQRMKDLGININSSLPYQYQTTEKWKPLLKEKRKFYRDNIEEIDVAHKAFRIRRMDHVQEMATRKGDLRVVVSANEQIRREFEKDGGDTNVLFNNTVYQQFNQLSNEELIIRQREATEKLKIKKEDANGPLRTPEENQE